MWQYGYRKTTEIGLQGILAGWGLSLLKDSLGYGLFFATFEYVKAQSYYAFITRYYGGLRWWNLPEEDQIRVLRPHYAIEPCFLMIAGIAASVSQQVVHHPFSLVQDIYHRSLAATDKKNRLRSPISQTLLTYMAAYQRTFQQCRSQAIRFGSWRRWLYRNFLWNTIKQVPSTSAGLIIFELVRRRLEKCCSILYVYSMDSPGSRISIPPVSGYEVAGPHLPAAYEVIPDAIHSLASRLINECVGRAGREGGFGTMEIGRLIDFVIDPSKDLAEYPPNLTPFLSVCLLIQRPAPSSSFLTVSVTSEDLKDPSPGNYDPLIADTLAGAARDAAMSVPASGAARKTLVQRARAFRARAMRMSAGRSEFPWWGGNGGRGKARWRLE
ncbi:MAG: hypothetical protein Q9207_002207 [Kuettlingeria erythrocarpa]